MKERESYQIFNAQNSNDIKSIKEKVLLPLEESKFTMQKIINYAKPNS
jgi:hypothetical protein